DWFGHGGSFPGFISQTAVVPQYGLTLSIVTNTSDRFANLWVDGAVHIMAAFARRGAPNTRVRDWTGRWWSRWDAVDLVPMGNRVLVANPALLNPVADASELAISGADQGHIALATGLANHGEAVRRRRKANGTVEEIWLGGTRLLPETAAIAELETRYAPRPLTGTALPRATKRRQGAGR